MRSGQFNPDGGRLAAFMMHVKTAVTHHNYISCFMQANIDHHNKIIIRRNLDYVGLLDRKKLA